MTSTIERTPDNQQPRAESEVMRDLIQSMVIETVQAAVDRGLTSVQGGEIALKRLTGLGWDREWMSMFGSSALATQWRDSISRPRQKFYEALPEKTPEPVVEAEVRPTAEGVLPRVPLLASPSATEQPEPDAVVEPAEHRLLPVRLSPAPQHAIQPVRHGREDSLSVLSRDMRQLLATQLTVAGIWVRAGELRRADVLTIMAESKQRMKSTLTGYRQRRDKLRALTSYYDNDAVDLNALALTGRFSTDQLRDFMDAIR